MKKSLSDAIAFLCVFMLSLSVVSASVYASDTLTEILIPESFLSNFEEKEEIEAMAEEVLDMANCFEEDGFHAEVSDIDFLNAYCVFVEANILEAMPKTTEELDKLLGSAHRVWNIPVHANGKTVLVQVSRGLELSEMDLDDNTEEEIERLKEKAGKWQTVSSAMYEDGEIPEQAIGEILSANHKDTDKCKCVLIGGESGIRTLLALVIENDAVSGAISLERTVSDELQQNQMYSLDEFAKVVSQNPSAIGYYIAGGAGLLGIIIVIGISIRKRLRNKC